MLISLGQQSPTFVPSGTSFTENNFSTDYGWGMVSVLLIHPLLISSWAAQFVTGHREIVVHYLEVGDLCSRELAPLEI